MAVDTVGNLINAKYTPATIAWSMRYDECVLRASTRSSMYNQCTPVLNISFVVLSRKSPGKCLISSEGL